MRSMTQFVLLVAVLTATRTHAQISPPQLREFLDTNRHCYVWASGYAAYGVGENAGKVFCIFNGVANAGTVHEQEGCMVGFFSVNTRRYDADPFGWEAGGGATPVAKERCSPKVVTWFLTSEAIIHGQASVSGYVRDVLGTLGALAQIGGSPEAFYPFGRAICSRSPPSGIPCERFSEAAEAEEKKQAKAAGKKEPKKPPTPKEDSVPVPPWLKGK